MNRTIFLLLILWHPLVANSATVEFPLPPTHLYHFGWKKVLLDDVALQEIPQPAWDRYVMGEETTWSLLPFRRGFYGTARAKDAERFVAPTVKKSREPWMIRFEIRPECRKRSFDPDRSLMDQRFLNWMESDPSRSSLRSCFDSRGKFLGRKYYAKDGENRCEKAMEEFLNKEPVAVVRDTAVSNSWYVRERDCLFHFEGNPSQVAMILVSDTSIWFDPDFFISTGRGPDVALALFLDALNDTSASLTREVSQVGLHLQQALASKAVSDSDGAHLRLAQEWISAVIRCCENGRWNEGSTKISRFLMEFRPWLVRDMSFSQEDEPMQTLEYWRENAATVCR